MCHDAILCKHLEVEKVGIGDELTTTFVSAKADTELHQTLYSNLSSYSPPRTLIYTSSDWYKPSSRPLICSASNLE